MPKRSRRVVAAIALAGGLLRGSASAQSPADTQPPAATAAAPQVPQTSSSAPAQRWSFLTAASSVLESNIDRNQQNNSAGGLVLGLGTEFRSRVERPAVVLQYEIGGHAYAGAPQWDRISHHARVAYERRVFKPLIVAAVGEISLKGSTEDRELGNQYVVSPRVQYRLTRDLRFEVEGGYRLRHYPDSIRNARNPYGGVSFTHRVGRGRWDVEYRYEENHADTDRYRYVRSTYGAEAIVPITQRDAAGIELKYRTRRYARLVRVGDSRVPLRDVKVSVVPQWVHAISPRLRLTVSYEFETRNANDPGRDYGAHSSAVGIERRW